jgi:hypothetical protein
MRHTRAVLLGQVRPDGDGVHVPDERPGLPVGQVVRVDDARVADRVPAERTPGGESLLAGDVVAMWSRTAREMASERNPPRQCLWP